MCKHHDLDDDLSDIFGPATITDEHANFVFDHLSKATQEPVKGAPVYEEPCPKCHGSGRFVAYSGRTVGNCFHCKGTGKVTFKSSPESRAKNQAQRDAVAARKQAELSAKIKLWIEEHDAETKWIVTAGNRGFGFAAQMFEALNTYGSLTERQLAAVYRCMAQDAARDEERQQIAERAPDVDAAALEKIHTAFQSALDKDVKFPKMRLDAYLFSLVRSGPNTGAIYVKTIEKDDLDERTYLGKIVDGRFVRAFKCSPEHDARIVAAASDPAAAAIAYGRREGACSLCGRKLTNHTSIDIGIGPICYEKYF